MDLFTLKRVHTPIVMQMETVDCGAAALAIILAHHGCSLPLELVSEQCLVSRDGVSIANLAKAASHFGLDTKIYDQIPFETIKLPIILFWNRKHYVVLEGIKRNKIYINDPKQGKCIIDWATFKQKFSNRVIQLQPNLQFKKHKLNLWHDELVPLVKKQWRPLIKLSMGMLVLSLLQLSPLVFTKWYIDNHLFSHLGQSTTLLIGVMIVIFLIQLGLAYKTRKLFRSLETQLAIQLNSQLISRLIHLPLKFFHFRRSADLLYRIQAVDRIVAEPWTAACALITALVQGVFSLLFLCTYSYPLAALAFSVWLIGFGGISLFKEQHEHLEHSMKVSIRDLGVLTACYLSNIIQIKAQGAEQRYLAKWQGLLAPYLNNYKQYSRKQEQKHISLLFILSMGYTALLASGMYLVFTNSITIGELMACQILFLSFNDALKQRNKFVLGKQQMENDLQYLADINHYPLPSKIIPSNNYKFKKAELFSIQLIDLTFGYSQEFKPLLDKVNLTIKAGEHVAIVGRSGSGKSTLVHLLSGLHQPWSGSILINGVPLLEYSLRERAGLIGVVSQQQFFYQGSIRDNLCLWHAHYSDNELLSVLKLACIDDLLTQTDDGLDFQLTEGATNLSGGQRQRLELARTLLAKPAILILDEATSSLDPLIEERVKKNLANYAATKIVIAHRFNTINDAQMLYLLDKGQLLNKNLPQRQNNTSDSFTQLFTTAE